MALAAKDRLATSAGVSHAPLASRDAPLASSELSLSAPSRELVCVCVCVFSFEKNPASQSFRFFEFGTESISSFERDGARRQGVRHSRRHHLSLSLTHSLSLSLSTTHAHTRERGSDS